MIRVVPLTVSVFVARGAWAQDVPVPPEPPQADPGPAEPITRAQLDELRAKVEALTATVEAQRQELAQQKLLLIPDEDLEFDLDGYYRIRGHLFNHLFASQDRDGEYDDARYFTQRLRLQPKITYKNLAKFTFQVDALDDVVFGDNAQLASTALFAGDPSTTQIEGGSVPSIRVSRAAVELTVPVGSLRAGRMASQWGMGLLANGGDGFDDTFGENHYGSTYDRILFATRPIAIGQAIAGKPDSNIPFYVAVGVDRLVEDPLNQYYGFECVPGLTSEHADFDERCDSDGDGTTDLEHDEVDDTRTEDDRTQDWWADQDDDVMEMVYVVVYRGEDVELLGANGDLTAGAYVVNRVQRETESNVLISDLYLNVKNRGVRVEFEGLNIRGHTRAIALSSGQSADPLYKEADIWGYVGRLGYERGALVATFETGFASGDTNVTDEDFTGRPLHPDHNVGLLLYEEVLARVTADRLSEAARGLWSNGGVYNSRYIFPNLSYEPLDNWKVIGGFLLAVPHEPDGAIVRCREGDDVECATYDAEDALLGTEVDLAIKHTWHEHAMFSLEAGYAWASDRLPLEASGLNPEGRFFTVQSRLAYAF